MTDLVRADFLAKAGYAARGAVYGLLGWFAWKTRRPDESGQEGVLARIQEMTGGAVLLWSLFAGLVAYGTYKLATGLLDIEHKGHKTKALLARVGMVLGAFAYLGLAWATLQFAMGLRRSAGSSDTADMAGSVLELPLGGAILVLAGLGFAVAAAFQARQTLTRSFMKSMDADAPRLTCIMGRIGFAARAVVFALVAFGLVMAGVSGNHHEARDLGGVLADLQGNRLIYGPVTVGLLVFGFYSLIQSRYRIVPQVDLVEAAKVKAAEKLA